MAQMKINHLQVRPFIHFLLNFLFHDLWLKVLSLAFAIMLYAILQSEQEKDFTKLAIIKLITAPHILVIGPQTRTVEATIRVPSTLFNQASHEVDLTGTLDLTHERTGIIRFKLSRDNFPNLNKNYGLFIKNPWLEVELDLEISKTVSVRPVLEGELFEGYEVKRVITHPQKVHISGARREVIHLDSLSTVPIYLDNFKESFSVLGKLNIPQFSSIKSQEELVSVQVMVDKVH